MTPKQNGYGVIKFKSPITGRYQTVNAHRLSFMVFNETMDISGMLQQNYVSGAWRISTMPPTFKIINKMTIPTGGHPEVHPSLAEIEGDI